MSRSGYYDGFGEDYNNQVELYRNAVDNALYGKRGQQFLREMLAALDALPNKRLIANKFEDKSGDVCALGSVGKARKCDMSELDPGENDNTGQFFGIARSMVAEIQFINDEDGSPAETPEQRFIRVREWVVKQIKNIP